MEHSLQDLSRDHDVLSFHAGDFFNPVDHLEENVAADDHERSTDDGKSPEGDFPDLLIVDRVPIAGGGLEVGEEEK